MPSPNLPTPDSYLVYPGMVLLEGTNLSEGCGTTRPFELFGAPRLDPHALAPRNFAWREPPYEYEETLLPIDILWGSPGLREGVEGGENADAILEGVEAELDAFAESVMGYLLY